MATALYIETLEQRNVKRNISAEIYFRVNKVGIRRLCIIDVVAAGTVLLNLIYSCCTCVLLSCFALCKSALLVLYVVECRMKNCTIIWKGLAGKYRERLSKTAKQAV